jgi:hypothetical protein
MLKNILNDFRRQNGQHPLDMNHYQEDEHCLWHCKHMADIQDCRHAPGHLLLGKSEAVAVRGFFRDHYEALRAVVFEQFANSMGHRDIILFNDNLACSFHVEHNCIFVTIRGW